MVRKSKLEAGLEAMAMDFVLPSGGKLKVARLVNQHLDWFDLATEHGLTWLDISRALASVGVTDRRGKALSFGTITAAVWRARAARSDQGRQRYISPSPAANTVPKFRSDISPKKVSVKKSKPDQREKPIVVTAPTTANRSRSTSSNTDIMNYMKRAAHLRKERR